MRSKNGEPLAYFEQHVMEPTDGCRFWPFGTSGGYGDLRIGKRSWRVHILACTRWHGARPDGRVAAHNCGKPLCWAGEHLRWATSSENSSDMMRHGTQPRTKAKMTPDDVRAIRSLWAEGSKSQQAIADVYGLTQATVSKIVLRQTWRDID